MRCRNSEYTSNIDTSAVPVVAQTKCPSRRVQIASLAIEISNASSCITFVSESEPSVIAADCPTTCLLEKTSNFVSQG
ncbi:unnamed protein product [Orchesella dallaii]|uniref:Uncharacterized protein n=1 Tax=Orchesella dallaii TaxID=48710 RepID=A0ABP1R6B4_9HEXA